jgi:hypothetical protein
MFLEPLGNVIRVEDGELRQRVHGLNFKMLSAQQFSARKLSGRNKTRALHDKLIQKNLPERV